jgi:bla regulator protein blaR1
MQIDLFLSWLFRSSWQAAVLIGLILMVQWLFKKQLSARWRYNLWLLVLVRLMMPVTPESSISLFNFVRSSQSYEETALNTSPPLLKLFQTVAAGDDRGSSPSLEVKSASPTFQPLPSSRHISLLSYFSTIDWRKLLSGVWVIGVIVFAIRLVLGTTILNLRISKISQITNTNILDILDQCKRTMNVRVHLQLIETSWVCSPALAGFFRPKLLLPLGTSDRLTPSELRHVFLHELAHIKRWDVATNWLIHGLQILHWMNPFIWFGFFRMRADRELACDALVLLKINEVESKTYGQTILKLVRNFSKPSLIPVTVGILEDKHQIKQRISLIARFSKGFDQKWIVGFALFISLGVVTLMDAQITPYGTSKGQNTKQPNKASMPTSNPFNDKLIKAIRDADLTTLKDLVSKGADINSISFENSTEPISPLLIAITENNSEKLDVVKYLLEKGASPNGSPDRSGPLAFAAVKGRMDLVNLLLEYRADVNQFNRNEPESSPLFLAVIMGHTQIVKILLDHGAGENKEVCAMISEVNSDENINVKKTLELLRERRLIPSAKIPFSEVIDVNSPEEIKENSMKEFNVSTDAQASRDTVKPSEEKTGQKIQIEGVLIEGPGQTLLMEGLTSDMRDRTEVQMKTLLQALKEKTGVKTYEFPMIAASNGKRMEINNQTELPFKTYTHEGGESNAVQMVGLKWSCLPTITKDGPLTLAVSIEKLDHTGWTEYSFQEPKDEQKLVKLKLPVVSKTALKSNVLIQPGEWKCLNGSSNN